MPNRREDFPAAGLHEGIAPLRDLEGHEKWIHCIGVTPSGHTVISGGEDGTVRVHEFMSGRLLHTLGGDGGNVLSIAATPDSRVAISGHRDGTLRVWDLESAQLLREIEGQGDPVWSLVVTPDGQTVVSGGAMVRVWGLESGKLLRTMEGHGGGVWSVAVTPDGCAVISGGMDGIISVRDFASGQLLHRLEGHVRDVTSVNATFDGRRIVSTSEDKTVRIWEASTGRLVRTMEGHQSYVAGLAVSRDGHWAATDSWDRTARIWELDSGRNVASLPVPSPPEACNMRVAFSPDGAHLLTVAKGDAGEVIRVWHVAFAQLGESQLAQDSISYRNAKVVMVGDTGVGKSGLGMVLAGEKFQPTDSTHGRRVWSFEPTDVSVGPGHRQRREIVLWDLAGQPGYRLVHKLNIDQATVALVLVDARSETDPLGVAEYWARGIAQTHSAVPITKFLVVARIDRGGLAVSAEELECFARQHDFAGVFQTSAKTGEGVLKLAEAIRGAIRWEELEEVGSNQLFVSIRQFLQKQKALGDKALVERVDDLFKRCAESSDQRLRKATLPDFRTCVGRLEAAGFVEILKFRAFKAGEDEAEFVLLQSEYIDAYASALLLAARKDDPRGLGHLLESDVVAGNLGLPEEERIAHREHERRVLAVAVERLLAHEIALRERIEEGGPEDGDYLVFPSEYTRQAPYPRRNAPGIAFDFEGATRSIFTTLVVRLAHHREFTKTEFFRDAACYEAKAGGRCAVVLDERQRAPGQGSMSVYFEDNPSLNEQHAFLRFVRRHLEAQAKPGSIEAHRLHFCRACGYAWEEALIEKRLRLGKADIVCPNCDERTPLFDLMMVEEDKACEGARQMDADADAMRRKELAAAAIEGKTRLGEYDVFLSYNTKDRAQVVILADGLRSIGIRPWLDVWDLVPGRPWQKGLHRAITRVKSAVVCVGVSGIGPWQDHEVAAFIRKFVKRDSAVIPALLPGARKQPKLPIFLESFRWVDLRDFRPDNTRPLANLVAGILGRRPGEMVPDQLVEQVASVLNIPTAAKKSLRGSQQIVLPVDLPVLSGIELEAIRQQIAQLLGIPSQQLEFVGIRRGSVILRVPDLKAANRLFAMFERNDPALRKLFRDWQISPDDFQNDNLAAPQTVRKAIASRKAKAEAEKASVSITRDEKKALKQWTAGATVLPVAVVFTDIVDSAKLCNDLGETPWGRIREDHFARAVSLTRQRDGFLVKNTGDGVLALFRNAHNAVNFARSLYDETGHAAVRIRVGVHSGEVNFDDNALWGRGDAWGQNLNFTARVMSHAKGDGIRVSDEVKRDLDRRRDPDGPKVRWVEYSKVKLKSFKGSFTLWGMEAA